MLHQELQNLIDILSQKDLRFEQWQQTNWIKHKLKTQNTKNNYKEKTKKNTKENKLRKKN